jgi:MFS transporter, DHA2 family, multidrug resistance protein
MPNKGSHCFLRDGLNDFVHGERGLLDEVPDEARPSWRGFLYFSSGAALLYAALDQGERLDWWRSSLFVALAVTGLFLILASGIRHFIQPNPMINFPFLRQGNTLLLGVVLVL